MVNGINSICKDLIKDNISSPASLNNNKVNTLWNGTTIRRILKNEVYIGNTIGHKVKKINYKLKKQIMLDKAEWIKVENTHEPIISKEDFEKAQNILNIRSYTPKIRKCTLAYWNYIL
ncbi:MAG: recombinase family protein [Clostridia bacterium]|nr:recombinase family protein [Clostridia bacterium]